MKLILFDCDGTLVDSVGNIHACMEETFTEAGFAAPELDLTKSIVGLTLNQAIARMLDRPVDRQVEAMVDRYRQHSLTRRAHPDFDEPFYDGIRSVLDALSQYDEILLGVVTGKSRRGLDSLMERHNLRPTIISSRTADECPSKPHPAMVLECCAETGIDPTQTLVVGDAVYDMQMARAAGAFAVGVSWGYASQQALHDAGAHTVVDRTEALVPLIVEQEWKETEHA